MSSPVQNLLTILLFNAAEEIKTLKHLNGSAECDEFFDSEEIKTKKANSTKYQRTCEFIESLLIETSCEVQVENSCNKLSNRLKSLGEQQLEEKTLLENTDFLENELKLLKQQLIDSEVESYEKLKEKDEQIGKLKDLYQDEITEYKLKTNYLMKYKNSTFEQLTTKLNKEEGNFKNAIKTSKFLTENERKVHFEIERYLNYATKEYENQIEYWKHRYQTDKDKMDAELKDLKERRKINLERMQAFKKQYAERAMEMLLYAEEKRKKFLEAEHKATLTLSAIKLQAWWRGVMVRHKLGPYKPKKSKGKSSKKSKKNSTKK